MNIFVKQRIFLTLNRFYGLILIYLVRKGL